LSQSHSVSLCNSHKITPSHRNLHPFPARMAPEIALRALASLPEGSTVLDPMCGSGTVLREALRHGHTAIGFDVDPLAALISHVSTHPINTTQLIEVGNAVADRATHLQDRGMVLPWIDSDRGTQEFINFWFAIEQRQSLRALAWLVARNQGPLKYALKLAISKIIITKKPCASLARDTSHSRPHRAASNSDYDVIHGFRRAVAQTARELERDPLAVAAIIGRSDARRLPRRLAGRTDMVVTSPPYGNAIDYLRGHRLALVWLGYNLAQLRAIRSKSIGSPLNQSDKVDTPILRKIASQLGPIDELDGPTNRRLYRFTRDMLMVMRQIHVALKPSGRAIMVMGNSTVKGTFLDNTRMITAAAQRVGLGEVHRYSREIPANHRYLPPPVAEGAGALGQRIKEEVVLTFEKAK
jgi:hypothetical protein